MASAKANAPASPISLPDISTETMPGDKMMHFTRLCISATGAMPISLSARPSLDRVREVCSSSFRFWKSRKYYNGTTTTTITIKDIATIPIGANNKLSVTIPIVSITVTYISAGIDH